jgi:hypothetical protein
VIDQTTGHAGKNQRCPDRANATVDKLNEDYHDKYLDRHQFLDHLWKSLDPHMTVARLNCSVSVLLIFPAHPLFKYSRSELGNGGRFYLQVLLWPNQTTRLHSTAGATATILQPGTW